MQNQIFVMLLKARLIFIQHFLLTCKTPIVWYLSSGYITEILKPEYLWKEL